MACSSLSPDFLPVPSWFWMQSSKRCQHGPIPLPPLHLTLPGNYPWGWLCVAQDTVLGAVPRGP